jgi:cytochrome c oxidase cbb3-type subunit 3
MTAHTRVIVGVIVAGAVWTGAVVAQSAGTSQTPPPTQTPPTTQAPVPQTQTPPGRGQDPGQRGGAGGGGANQGQGGQGRGGGRRGGFTQYTRELAPQDVIVRGKSLYEANCASCHASDMRGGPNATNLLRSGTALADKQGELIGGAVAKHSPAITLVENDTVAIAEYLHSVLATMGGQGSPPGRNPVGLELNVLVGDAMAGASYFQVACGTCHSVTGDLANIGSRYQDARALQNAWVSGSGGRFGGGGGGRGGGGNQVTVTMADGSKIEGTLIRRTDWLVILTLADGTRKSIARDPNTGVPKLDVKDPKEAHKKMVLELDDPTNKKMHDVTAYLWTVK